MHLRRLPAYKGDPIALADLVSASRHPLLHLPVRADLPHFHSSVPCCCCNSEIIALGFRAGVQTVSESTTAKCGHGDYYNWRLSDDNSVEATDPPLPPGCLLPYWSTVFPITRLCEVIVRGIKVETLFHFFLPTSLRKSYDE